MSQGRTVMRDTGMTLTSALLDVEPSVASVLAQRRLVPTLMRALLRLRWLDRTYLAAQRYWGGGAPQRGSHRR